jgi:hypothetical protein
MSTQYSIYIRLRLLNGKFYFDLNIYVRLRLSAKYGNLFRRNNILRWTHLLKRQRLPFIVRLPKKTNFCFPNTCIYTHIYIQIYMCVNIHKHTYIHTYIYICCCFKQKTEARRFSLIRLPSAHHANGSLPFVHLLTKKQIEVIRLQTD